VKALVVLNILEDRAGLRFLCAHNTVMHGSTSSFFLGSIILAFSLYRLWRHTILSARPGPKVGLDGGTPRPSSTTRGRG